MEIQEYIKLRAEYKVKNRGHYLFLETTKDGKTHVVRALKFLQALSFVLADGHLTIGEISDKISSLFKHQVNAMDILEIFHQHKCLFITSKEIINTKNKNARLKEIVGFLNSAHALPMDPYFSRQFTNLMIFVTNRCTQDCVYCFLEKDLKRDNNYNTLTMDDIQMLALQASKLNIRTVELCGGEPLERTDIISIIEAFTQYGLYVKLSTKRNFTEEFVLQLKKSHVNEFNISLDTISQEIAHKLIGNPNYAVSGLLKSVQLLIGYEIPFTIKTVVTSVNIHTIPQMVEKLYIMGCRNFEIMPYFNYSGDADREQLYPNQNDLNWLGLQLNNLSVRLNGINLNVFFDRINGDCGSKNKISFCSARSSGLVVHSDGTYGFCANSLDSRLRFSHIYKMTLAEAWDSQELHDFIFPSKDCYASTDCGNCKRFYECLPSRCHVRALKLYNNLWEKDSYCKGMC